MSYVAFIPARSGSKRIMNKNVRLINGKPLLSWTLDACIACPKITNVILSTDSMEYWNIAKNHSPSEKLRLDFRENIDASDNKKIFDYIKEKRVKIFNNFSEKNFILCLPTAPLRSVEHLLNAISLFEKVKSPIFSATEFEFPVSFSFESKNNGGWKPLFANSPMISGDTRSQDNSVSYRPNGAIYIRKILDLNDANLLTLYQGATPFYMNRTCSIDIDDEIDFLIAETLMTSKV